MPGGEKSTTVICCDLLSHISEGVFGVPKSVFGLVRNGGESRGSTIFFGVSPRKVFAAVFSILGPLLFTSSCASSDDSSAPPSCKVKSLERNDDLLVSMLQESPLPIESPVPRFQATFEFSVGNLRQELIQAAESFLASPQFEELDTGHEILGFSFGVVFNTNEGNFAFEPMKRSFLEYEQDSAEQFFDQTPIPGEPARGIKHSSKWETSGWYSANPKMMSIKSCSIISATMDFGDTVLATFKV